jgi:hypothetical protein
MTKLLDRAAEAARNLPPDAQDEIAHVILRLAGADDEPPVPLTPEQQTAINASKAAAARGEFATDASTGAMVQTRSLRLCYTLPAFADLTVILDYSPPIHQKVTPGSGPYLSTDRPVFRRGRLPAAVLVKI